MTQTNRMNRLTEQISIELTWSSLYIFFERISNPYIGQLRQFLDGPRLSNNPIVRFIAKYIVDMNTRLNDIACSSKVAPIFCVWLSVHWLITASKEYHVKTVLIWTNIIEVHSYVQTYAMTDAQSTTYVCVCMSVCV